MSDFHQHSVARAASIIAKVTVDHGDGTFTLVRSAGAGTYSRVPAPLGMLVTVDSWWELERAGPGWRLSSPASHQGGV